VRFDFVSGMIGFWTNGDADQLAPCPMPLTGADDIACSALVARIGADVFRIGNGRTITVGEHSGGTVDIGYNLNAYYDPGSWQVSMTVYGSGATATASPTGTATPPPPTATGTATSTGTPTSTPQPAATGVATITNTGDWIATGQLIAAGQAVHVFYQSGTIGY
jgi:hypothetical protein